MKVSEFDGQTFAAPNYDRQKVADTLGPQGSIALQVHGGASWPAGAKCRKTPTKRRRPSAQSSRPNGEMAQVLLPGGR